MWNMGRYFLQTLIILIMFTLATHSYAESTAVLSLKPVRDGLKQAKIKINGISTWMILDTGGGWTIVGNKLADEIGCKPFGQITGFRQSGQKLSSPKCGTFSFDVKDRVVRGFVSLYDVASVLPKNWPKVDGLVAFPSLGIERFTLDWSKNRIILETPQSLKIRTKGLPVGRIRIQSESAATGKSIFVEISAKPEPLWFLLDSGNIAATLVAPSSLEQLGIKIIKPDKAAKKPIRLNLDLRIAGRKIENLPVDVVDIIYDGNLGVDFLNRYVVTIDMANHQIWFKLN